MLAPRYIDENPTSKRSKEKPKDGLGSAFCPNHDTTHPRRPRPRLYSLLYSLARLQTHGVTMSSPRLYPSLYHGNYLCVATAHPFCSLNAQSESTSEPFHRTGALSAMFPFIVRGPQSAL